LNYIAYLNQTPKNLNKIRKVHLKYIDTYLIDQAARSQTQSRSLLKRWFGNGVMNSHLNDPNYLMMFKAIYNIGDQAQASDVDLTASIKQAVLALLNEYLQYSWFISAQKKRQTRLLITSIQDAESVSELINILTENKLSIAALDIAKNKRPAYRRFKSQNITGSRLQATLDNALDLALTISDAKTEDKYRIEVAEKLAEVSDSAEVADQYTSYDDFKNKSKTYHYRDRYNARILEKSMETVFKRDFTECKGMTGRRIFQPKKS
jgi:hypothetical protein